MSTPADGTVGLTTPATADDVTVADCEAAQTAYFRALARRPVGRWWEDGPLRWALVPGTTGLSLMFPAALPEAALHRGIAVAAALEVDLVGAWLSLATDPEPLLRNGFTLGWSPWWMAVDLTTIPPPDDPRVTLREAADPADLVALRPQVAWHAVARVDGEDVGGAVAHRVGSIAGIFDMGIREDRQRRGLGRALLRTLAAAACADGAVIGVLNATAAGEKLYSAEGFRRVGEGITYWLHRR